MTRKIIPLLALSLLLASCTPGANPLKDVPGKNGKVAGFLNGFWDGAIAPITLVVSWFNPNVSIYNPNSDVWYPLGFMMGVGGLTGGSASYSRKS